MTQISSATLQYFVSSSIEGLDIAEFDKFVLKKGVPQTITAPWHFKELHYTDNQQACRINGLNFAQDVLRYDQPRPVTGHKHFMRLFVNNTNCPVPCYFGDINMSEWIGKAVLTFGNYTIQGTTILRDPVVYGNIWQVCEGQPDLDDAVREFTGGRDQWAEGG
jgi:hypothetical protein